MVAAAAAAAAAVVVVVVVVVVVEVEEEVVVVVVTLLNYRPIPIPETFPNYSIFNPCHHQIKIYRHQPHYLPSLYYIPSLFSRPSKCHVLQFQ